jgi:hypothetical protein
MNEAKGPPNDSWAVTDWALLEKVQAQVESV